MLCYLSGVSKLFTHFSIQVLYNSVFVAKFIEYFYFYHFSFALIFLFHKVQFYLRVDLYVSSLKLLDKFLLIWYWGGECSVLKLVEQMCIK